MMAKVCLLIRKIHSINYTCCESFAMSLKQLTTWLPPVNPTPYRGIWYRNGYGSMVME